MDLCKSQICKQTPDHGNGNAQAFFFFSVVPLYQNEMMKLIEVLLVFLSLIALPIQSLNSTCPIDFSYVLRVPFNSISCKNFQAPPKTPETDTTTIPCCQTLLSLFGIGLAQQLKDTSLFLLPNIDTSITCFQNYQSNLTSLSLPSNVVSSCFDPKLYVTNPNGCAHIESYQDWVSKLNQTAAFESFDTACKPDLTNRSYCDACLTARISVQAQLINLDGNDSHNSLCWSSIVLYAAGMINEFGPESNGSVSCLFGLSTDSHVGSPKKRITVLVIVIVSVTAGLLTILISYLVWRKTLQAKGRY